MHPVLANALNNLSQVRCSFKLKKIIYTYIVSQILTLEQRKSLSQVFKVMDRDCDGVLSEADINTTLELIHENYNCKDHFGEKTIVDIQI